MDQLLRLNKTLEKNRNQYLETLKALIACDTQVIGHGIEGGNEINGQLYLESVLLSMGAKVFRQPLNELGIQKAINQYQEGNSGHNYENSRCNLYGTFQGKNYKTLLFNGHVDTMPTGNLHLWKSPPFIATLRDGKLFGLGASDMKGGLVAAISAIRLLNDAGFELPCNVTIMSVADEEGGGNGTIIGAMEGIEADAAVVCEPTNGYIYTSSMGFVFFEVSVKGVSLHSAEKWKGISAIEKATYLIDALDKLERQWIMENKHPHLPPPTLNVGYIHGGVAGSVVPNECVFRLCAHYHPNTMSHNQMIEDLSNCIELASDGDAWLKNHRPEYHVYQAGHAFEVPENEKIVQDIVDSWRTVCGSEPKIGGASYGADARVLYNISRIPTIIAGPGNIQVCHAPNECIEIEDFFRFVLVYAQLIMNWAK